MPGNVVARDEFEDGPAKQARIRKNPIMSYYCKYSIESKAEYLSFLTWFYDTVHGGALWFDWTDPVDGVLKQARIVADTFDSAEPTTDLEYWAVSFVIEYKRT